MKDFNKCQPRGSPSPPPPSNSGCLSPLPAGVSHDEIDSGICVVDHDDGDINDDDDDGDGDDSLPEDGGRFHQRCISSF